MLEQYVAADLEMTGLRAKTDRILEIGAVKVENHRITKRYQRLVNPGIALSQEITELTGITNEMAARGVSIEEAVEGFFEFSGKLPLVGHNIIFDYSFLKQYAVNHKQNYEATAVDTLKLSRKFLPEAEKKTLEYLCQYFKIERTQSHRALEDAEAAHCLLEILADRFGKNQPEEFEPKQLNYKAKKQTPIMPKQKKYLMELAGYHKIELAVNPDSLTRSEASRLIDKLLAKYGRSIPKQLREH